MFRLLRLLVRLRWPLWVFAPFLGKYNPLRPEHRVDPYPQYRALRESHPIYFHPVFRAWILSRYEDVAAALRDPRFSVDRTQANVARGINPFRSLRGDFLEVIRGNLLMLDPPDHTRIRNLVNKAFTPRVVEGLRPRIQAIVDELLDGVRETGEMDLIRDLAYPLPVTVIAELLGIPAEKRARLKKWSDDLTGLVDPLTAGADLAQLQDTFGEVRDYFERIFAARRAQPQDDLISRLVAAEAEGETLSASELLSTCILILGAGHETTTNLIGNAVVALLLNPGERKQLEEDPGLIARAVEEFLRYDSPVQVTDRVAKEDLEIAGQPIRKGQIVGLLLGAANRDPVQFPEPDRLDLRRPDNRHLSFGHGVHFCLGAALARAEAQIAIGGLVRRFPHFEGAPDPRSWKFSFVLRGLVSLPLHLGEPA